MSEEKKKKPYADSPLGVAQYAWVNKPDTKFNERGVYKLDLVVAGAPAVTFKEKLDAELEAGFAEFTKDMTPKEKKTWSIHKPYEVLTDDADVPTGEIVYHFRQNAKLITKDKKEHDIKIELRDSKGNEIKSNPPVYSGSVLLARYTTRGITMQATKQWGLRLDFMCVQIKTLGKGRGSGGNFQDLGDDGYVDDGGRDEAPHDEAASDAGSPKTDY